MMQVYQSYISLQKLFFFLWMAVLFSCTDEAPGLNQEQQVNVKLTLELTRQTRVGARSDAGVGALNENVIHTVDLFLYKKGDVAANEQPEFTQTNIALPVVQRSE